MTRQKGIQADKARRLAVTSRFSLCRWPATVDNCMIPPDLNRVAKLANRLAERTLEAPEHGRLTTEEFRERPDVALIFEAGAEFPGGIVRLPKRRASKRRSDGLSTAKEGEPIAGVAADLRRHPALQCTKPGSLAGLFRSEGSLANETVLTYVKPG